MPLEEHDEARNRQASASVQNAAGTLFALQLFSSNCPHVTRAIMNVRAWPPDVFERAPFKAKPLAQPKDTGSRGRAASLIRVCILAVAWTHCLPGAGGSDTLVTVADDIIPL